MILLQSIDFTQKKKKTNKNIPPSLIVLQFTFFFEKAKKFFDLNTHTHILS